MIGKKLSPKKIFHGAEQFRKFDYNTKRNLPFPCRFSLPQKDIEEKNFGEHSKTMDKQNQKEIFSGIKQFEKLDFNNEESLSFPYQPLHSNNVTQQKSLFGTKGENEDCWTSVWIQEYGLYLITFFRCENGIRYLTDLSFQGELKRTVSIVEQAIMKPGFFSEEPNTIFIQYVFVGEIHYRNSPRKAALHWLEKAEKLSQIIPETSENAEYFRGLYNMLAFIMIERKRKRQAKEYFKKRDDIIQRFIAINEVDKAIQAACNFRNEAMFQRKCRNYQEAVKLYLKSIECREKNLNLLYKYQMLSNEESEFAAMYLEMGEVDHAEQINNRALSNLKKVQGLNQNHYIKGKILMNKAEILYYRGYLEKAGQKYEKAIQIFGFSLYPGNELLEKCQNKLKERFTQNREKLKRSD